LGDSAIICPARGGAVKTQLKFLREAVALAEQNPTLENQKSLPLTTHDNVVDIYTI
jgi:hypothetical protein